MLPDLHDVWKVKVASLYRLRPTKVCKIELTWEYEWFIEHPWVLRNGMILGLKKKVTNNTAC